MVHKPHGSAGAANRFTGSGMGRGAKQKAGIKSVEVSATILRALMQAERPLPLKDLAKLARMHPGKVHRYLVSLTRSELVTQNESSGRYGIGPMAISLGLSGLRGIDVVREATALMPPLRDEIGETVLLSIWSPKGPIVFALEESSRPVFMNVRVGSILPLLTTAAGQVFAAFLPPESVAGLLADEAKRSRSAGAKLLSQVRARGAAAVEGTLVPGVSAVAVPIFDHNGRIAGVIGALGRSEELNIDFAADVARALLRIANEISRRLGKAAQSIE
jgi:DNA-binding IclR family transcriptional regulator